MWTLSLVNRDHESSVNRNTTSVFDNIKEKKIQINFI